MITVLGSINMDLVAKTARLPKPGETVAGTAFATAAGGKGANQALAVQRAGRVVRMAGTVGDDQFAETSLALLKEAGASLGGVRRVHGPTGTALILVGSDGENMIAVVPGANGLVAESDADMALSAMREGDILVLQLEVPAVTVEHALRVAKGKGIVTVLNLAPLVDDAARLGHLADVVIANETEFERLAGEQNMSPSDREEAMRRLHAQSGQTLIVTLGAGGVVAIREAELVKVAGLTIQPVDTVGAGDTFCGYFAAAMDEGVDFRSALRRAAVAGSLACLREGAQPSIPWAKDVLAKV